MGQPEENLRKTIENHGKTHRKSIGNPEENHRNIWISWDLDGLLYSGTARNTRFSSQLFITIPH